MPPPKQASIRITHGRKRRIDAIRRLLPRWFAQHARRLPWRENRTPYRVWVAEVLLQQTRVSAVGPYYRRFLRRFPNVRALAAAPPDDVLKAWEGLGYYSRARNLHKAARAVVAERGGRLPDTAEELRRLPGIGRYTAGAIASIAFGRDEPVVDGNVIRVLCRLFGIAEDPRAAATREKLWQLAAALLPPGEAANFNEALMDLGATVCTPDSPRCGACPAASVCRAREHGQQHRLPRRRRKPAVPHHTIVCGIISDGRGRVLIDQRPAEGLLGGLWELPGGKVEPGESLAEALRREVQEEVGLEVEIGEEVTVIRHAYSHFRITMHAFCCRRTAGRARARVGPRVRWVRPADLGQYAMPRANRKLLAAIGAATEPGE